MTDAGSQALIDIYIAAHEAEATPAPPLTSEGTRMAALKSHAAASVAALIAMLGASAVLISGKTYPIP